MFAAVGNDAEKKNLIDYPAAYDGVVGVAAADDSGKVGKFSEHGGLRRPGRPRSEHPQVVRRDFHLVLRRGRGHQPPPRPSPRVPPHSSGPRTRTGRRTRSSGS